ncbi:site-specific integrase [bacterium]|nr:site-specific integrase [bacterium]MBU3956181.1 site-specific integrase [bacterium]
MKVFKKGKSYIIDYTHEGIRRRESLGQISKRTAEDILAKRRTMIVENRHLDIRRDKKISFSKYAQDYLLWWKSHNADTYTKTLSLVRQLETTFGKRYLYNIDVKKVEDYRTGRLNEVKKPPMLCRTSLDPKVMKRYTGTEWQKKKISKPTVNKEIGKLKAMLNKAVDWGYLSYNRALKVKKYSEKQFQKGRHLSESEIKSLLGGTAGYLHDVIEFDLFIGRRIGEVLQLKWEDVNWETRIIKFFNQKSRVWNNVWISDAVYELLERRKSTKNGQYVFCQANGKQIKSIRKTFGTVLKRLGIMNFRIHDMRHTAISYMVMQGLPNMTIAGIVGHASGEMIERRYGHLSTTHLRDSLQKHCNGLVTIMAQPPKNERTEGIKNSALYRHKKPS